jgi:glycosyltransferase involved in cell wall biosynthesis
MLSVIIATLDSERALVPTLAALVPGATAGLISEVIIADAGSRDETAAVADVAGAGFLLIAGPLGRRLKTAARTARAPWLMFLRPGIVLEAPWTGVAQRFVELPPPHEHAATFRRGAAGQTGVREAVTLLGAALWGRPHPEQGLIISKTLYENRGGHAENATDPERQFLRRLGNRRIVTLPASAFRAG